MAGQRRWVVRPGDGSDLRSVLSKLAPDDLAALREGRVFVGQERAKSLTHALRAGDVVVVHAPRKSEPEQPVILLHQGAGLIAVYKPAGLPTIADHQGNDALLGRVARLAGLPESALHPTSRLDAGVSGVVTFAITPEARERLANAREQGRYGRRYVAIARCAPPQAQGVWDAPIGRASQPRLRAAFGRDAVASRSRFAVIAVAPGGEALLRLEPETGRTHQLRVHAAHAGAPLLGDIDYGGPGRLILPSGAVRRLTRVALHALRVEVPGADLRGPLIRIEAPVPEELRALWTALGGEEQAWQKAAQ